LEWSTLPEPPTTEASSPKSSNDAATEPNVPRTAADESDAATAGAPAPASFFDPNLARSGRPQVFPEHGASILSTYVESHEGRKVNVLQPNERAHLVMRIGFARRIDNVRFSWTLRTNNGLVLAGGSTHRPGSGFDGFDVGETVVVRFPFRNIFTSGLFTIDVGVRGIVVEIDDFAHNIAEALVIRTLDRDVYCNGFVDCHSQPGAIVDRVTTSVSLGQAGIVQSA